MSLLTRYETDLLAFSILSSKSFFTSIAVFKSSLIENVGCGCSVANADKSLKKVANEFTDSNENKGVEHIIKKYF